MLKSINLYFLEDIILDLSSRTSYSWKVICFYLKFERSAQHNEVIETDKTYYKEKEKEKWERKHSRKEPRIN